MASRLYSMADLDKILGMHELLLHTRQVCTPKRPGVHAEAQTCTGSSGWIRRMRQKTYQSQGRSVHQWRQKWGASFPPPTERCAGANMSFCPYLRHERVKKLNAFQDQVPNLTYYYKNLQYLNLHNQ